MTLYLFLEKFYKFICLVRSHSERGEKGKIVERLQIIVVTKVLVTKKFLKEEGEKNDLKRESPFPILTPTCSSSIKC